MITKVIGREVLDSRGNPTVEVEIWAGEKMGSAIVPSGASTGVHEALELRDGDVSRYHGKGVLKALSFVEGALAEFLAGRDLSDLTGLDREMIALDGTDNKGQFGANAILGCSMALRRLKAVLEGRELWEVLHDEYVALGGAKQAGLPVPYMNVINGGAHADSGLDAQEFMIVPHGFDSFAERIRAGVEIYHVLKKRLKAEGYVVAVGDEGGFAPALPSSIAALEILIASIEEAGYEVGTQVSLAMDVAASEFYKDGVYYFEGNEVSSEGMVAIYTDLVERFPIISLEDGIHEDDFEGWKLLTERIGDKVQLVGDDLYVTNTARVEKGIAEKWANALLVKLNQIGTVTETLEVICMMDAADQNCMISHRSGETEDTFIADLVYAVGSGQIKSGAPCRSERTSKYNRLLRLA